MDDDSEGELTIGQLQGRTMPEQKRTSLLADSDDAEHVSDVSDAKNGRAAGRSKLSFKRASVTASSRQAANAANQPAVARRGKRAASLPSDDASFRDEVDLSGSEDDSDVEHARLRGKRAPLSSIAKPAVASLRCRPTSVRMRADASESDEDYDGESDSPTVRKRSDGKSSTGKGKSSSGKCKGGYNRRPSAAMAKRKSNDDSFIADEDEDDYDFRIENIGRTSNQSSGRSLSTCRQARTSRGGHDRYLVGRTEVVANERETSGWNEYEDDEDDDEEAEDTSFYFQVDQGLDAEREEQADVEGLGIGITFANSLGSVFTEKDALDAYFRFLVAALVDPENMKVLVYVKTNTPDAVAWRAVMKIVETRLSAATKSLGVSEHWRDDTGSRERSRLPFVKSAVYCLPYYHVTARKHKRARTWKRRRVGNEYDEDNGYKSSSSDEYEKSGGDGGPIAGVGTDACHACRVIGHPGNVSMTLSGPLVPSDLLMRDNKEWLDAIPHGEFRSHEFKLEVGNRCAERIAIAMALLHWKYKMLLCVSRLVQDYLQKNEACGSASKDEQGIDNERTQPHVDRVGMELRHLLDYSGARPAATASGRAAPDVDEDEIQDWEQSAVDEAARFADGLRGYGRGSADAISASLDSEDELEACAPKAVQESIHFDVTAIMRHTTSIRALTWAGDPSRRSFLRSKAAFLVWMRSNDHGTKPAALESANGMDAKPSKDGQSLTPVETARIAAIGGGFSDEILRPSLEAQKQLHASTDAALGDTPFPPQTAFNLGSRLLNTPSWKVVIGVFETEHWDKFVTSEAVRLRDLLRYVDVYATRASKKEREEAQLAKEVMHYAEDRRDQATNSTMLAFAPDSGDGEKALAESESTSMRLDGCIGSSKRNQPARTVADDDDTDDQTIGALRRAAHMR